jgi:hypothetical protein
MGVKLTMKGDRAGLRVDAHLDWLHYTVPYNERLSEMQNVLGSTPTDPLFELTGETASTGRGYNHALRMTVGIVLWNDTRPEQGIGVEFTGRDLAEIRESTNAEIALLQFVVQRGGWVSTLHACINIHNAGANVDDLISEHEAGQLRTRARMVGVFVSTTKQGDDTIRGQTLYLGSPRSDIQIRIYNKAAEQGIKADWTRIEIVWRGDLAKQAHHLMIKTGIAPVVRGAVIHQMQSDVAWWPVVTTGTLARPQPQQRKLSNRAVWLRDVVIPALRSELQAEDRAGSSELREAFLRALGYPPATQVA